LRGIVEIHGIASDGAAATVRSSAPGELLHDSKGGAWIFDPLVVDSGLQLVILWARAQLDMTPLPTSIRAVRRYATRLPPKLRCETRVSARQEGHLLHSDIAFLDPAEQVVLLIEGIEWSCHRRLNRLALRQRSAVQ
jgi:hypothetical protein